MSPRASLSLSIFSVIATLSSQARAADIIFKLRDNGDNPVAGWVEMTTAQQSAGSATQWIMIAAANTGEGVYSNAKCDRPGILFRAGSYDLTYFLGRSEM